MHDKNGKPIAVGDKVTMVGKVTQTAVGGNGAFCSVEVHVEGDWNGSGEEGKQWFSAGQLEVIESAPVVEAPVAAP